MNFWLFRSNIRELEYYHQFKDLETFKEKCHDFYMLFPIWMLENDLCDEVTIWRLHDYPVDEITFDINGKKYHQRFVKSFNEVFKYRSPDVSFFRGGFPEYDEVTSMSPEFFGLKLYLGASKRVTPQYGGVYDKILVESDEQLSIPNSVPFYKTANPNIFKPLNYIHDKHYDLCWICNFTQIRHKGQEFFINEVSKSRYLKFLNIIHIGNDPEVGIDMCKKYGVTNISFLGSLDRNDINVSLNLSKFGIVTSNQVDGCPRVSTEVLCSGTPLLIRKETNLLFYYKEHYPVLTFDDGNIERVIENNLENYNIRYRNKKINIDFNEICKKNFDLWK